MLVSHQERPRELKWYHAGPMLYGDWGTSRFYVLGLALFFALHASFWYVFAVGLLVAAVGWAYTIICRCYPDGGGVYSAARHTSKQLAVVGALLLFADYIVTAAMSAYDGIRYMGVDKAEVPYLAMGAILAIGFINYIGPKKAGTIALIITLATLVLTTILGVFSVSHLVSGWEAIHRPVGNLAVMWTSFVGVVLALSGVEAIANMTGIMVPPVTKTANKAIWPVLLEVVILNIILAIAMNGLPASGYDLGKAPVDVYEKVEHIKEQFAGTSAADNWATNPAAQDEFAKLSADSGISTSDLKSLERSEELKKHQDDTTDAVLRVMAAQYVDPHMPTVTLHGQKVGLFSLVCGFVFGLLLLSAVNTAVADMISIQYVMSRDTELPHILTRLNGFGVPWYALIGAVGLPILILTIFQDLTTLASLYAVGVVGAIAINLGSCCVNKLMPVKTWERVGLGVLAVIMVCIEVTLVWQKPDARYFALFVVGCGLLMRFSTKTYPKFDETGRAIILALATVVLLVATATVGVMHEPISGLLVDKVPGIHSIHSALLVVVGVGGLLLVLAGSCASTGVAYFRGQRVAPELGQLAASSAAPTLMTRLPTTPPQELDFSRPHVMVATRGGRPLLEFAADYARDINGLLFILFVRQINVMFAGPMTGPGLEEDPEAQQVFALAADIAKAQGVQMVPMYVVSSDVAYSILDFAATYNAKALLMGVSRKGSLLRALQGDVITSVADHLPNNIPLLIHA